MDVAFAVTDFRREGESTVSFGGGEGVMNPLASALDSAKAFGVWPDTLADVVPMATDALPKLAASASDDDPPPVAAHQKSTSDAKAIPRSPSGEERKL